MAVTLIGNHALALQILKVTTKAPTIRFSGKGSTFGAAWDIYIADHANSYMESYAFLGGNRVYELPDGVGINVNS